MKPLRLSNEDRDDLFKYTRYFALKASQIIISSRSGNRDSTPCRKKSDWFNLNVADIPGLLATAKKNISNKINYGCPVCVEIFLQTPEGDKMVLETWCICLLPEYSDPISKITHTVYNQMGILLKSLVSVTRVIPAYKLSQRQGSDTYTIFFRMYEKEPEIHSLGDGCTQVRIGQICTPIGTLQVSVAYRVTMTFTPTQSSSHGSSMLLKSDHFNADLCPRFKRNKEGEWTKKGQSIKAAFADPSPPRTKEHLTAFKPGGVVWYPKLYYAIIQQHKKISSGCIEGSNAQKDNCTDCSNNLTRISPSESPKEEVERRITYSANLEELVSSEISFDENCSCIPKTFRQSYRNVAKPMLYPFATPTPKSELVNFYRECVHAPPLVSLLDTTSSVKDITEQLVSFEMKAKEFDEMVKSFCESPDSDD